MKMKEQIVRAITHGLIFATVGAGGVFQALPAHAAHLRHVSWCDRVAPRASGHVARSIKPHIIVVDRSTIPTAALSELPIASTLVLSPDDRQHGIIIVRGTAVSFARLP
jgi:hypothetical protein